MLHEELDLAVALRGRPRRSHGDPLVTGIRSREDLLRIQGGDASIRRVDERS